MAQAFFERHAPDDLRAESAGQAPAETIWPNVIEAMSEVGIDISARRPKKIDREMQLHADKAITLNCQESCPYVIGGVEDLGSRSSLPESGSSCWQLQRCPESRPPRPEVYRSASTVSVGTRLPTR
jgi:hypothetical protein